MSETDSPENTTPRASKRQVTYLTTEEELDWRYSNSVNVGSSIWDFRLRFALAVTATGDSLTLRDVAQIIMSPQHAKALANVLNIRLKKYEDQFGPLPEVRSTITESEA